MADRLVSLKDQDFKMAACLPSVIVCLVHIEPMRDDVADHVDAPRTHSIVQDTHSLVACPIQASKLKKEMGIGVGMKIRIEIEMGHAIVIVSAVTHCSKGHYENPYNKPSVRQIKL